LQRLHSVLTLDFLLMKSTECLVKWLIPIVGFLVVLACTSLSIGHTVLVSRTALVRSLVLLMVPFLAFLGELTYLGVLLGRERIMRSRAQDYRRTEYY